VLVRRFLYLQDNPDDDQDVEEIPLAECPYLFNVTDVSVFHLAQATFFAPSNASGVHGMYRETIRSTPRWTRGEIPGPRRDCVFISAPGDETDTTVNDLNVARVLSFFSFSRSGKVYQCVLVHWFSTFGCEPDPDTGMWVVVPDYDRRGYRNVSVIAKGLEVIKVKKDNRGLADASSGGRSTITNPLAPASLASWMAFCSPYANTGL